MNAFLFFLLLLTAHQGRVMFGNVPVPGATVTAIQGEKKFVAVTDPQGTYSFPDLAEGPFAIQVEMRGFSTIRQEVSGPSATFEVKMLPIQEIHAEIVRESPTPAPAEASPDRRQGAGPPGQTGFRQTDINTADAASTPATNAAPPVRRFRQSEPGRAKQARCRRISYQRQCQ